MLYTKGHLKTFRTDNLSLNNIKLRRENNCVESSQKSHSVPSNQLLILLAMSFAVLIPKEAQKMIKINYKGYI